MLDQSEQPQRTSAGIAISAPAATATAGDDDSYPSSDKSTDASVVASKQMADVLCECPQLCHRKISDSLKRKLFDYFYSLSDEPDKQNRFLQSNMRILANRQTTVRTENGIDVLKPKRVLCKYYLPNLETKTSIEVCQKAFINAFVITTKRVRMQREKLIERMRQDDDSVTDSSPDCRPQLQRLQPKQQLVGAQIAKSAHTFQQHKMPPPPQLLRLQQRQTGAGTKADQYDFQNPSDQSLQILKTFFENQLWNPNNL